MTSGTMVEFNEPTTYNQFQQLPAIAGPIADGSQVEIWMTAFSERSPGTTPTTIVKDAPARLVALSHYAHTPATTHFPSTNYLVADIDPGATGDIFTVRTWIQPVSSSVPFSGASQYVILQSPDGLYLQADGSGFYHATAQENDASVFVLVIGGTAAAPRGTLYPAFYSYADRFSTSLPPAPVGLYSVQFVRPMAGGGVDANNSPLPLIQMGPIQFQQVQGTPPSSVLAFDLMQEFEGVTMPYGNGQRLMDANGKLYIVLDGELRQIPGGVTNTLFTPKAASAIQHIAVPTKNPVGPPIGTDARLINVAGQPEIWLCVDQVKRWIESPAVLSLYGFNMANLKTVTAERLAIIPSGPPIGMNRDCMPFPAGTRVREASTGKIFLAIDNQLRWIPNPATYDDLFTSWAGVVGKPALPADRYRIGPPLTDGGYLATSAANEPIYLMVDGVKRHIVNPAAMNRFKFNWSKVRVDPAALAAVGHGADVDF